MAPQTKSTTIVLDTPETWKSWLFVVKTMALGARVWDYIDPESNSPQPVPSEPILPEATTVKPTAKDVTNLTAEERDVYKLLLASYKENSIKTAKILDSLQSIQTHIVTSITSNNTTYIEEETSIHGILVALKNRLAPTDQARKIEVRRAYQSLKTNGKRQEVETWLRN